jgi:hypothetical protein
MILTKCWPLIGREVSGQLCQNYSSESLHIKSVGSYRDSTGLVSVLVTPPWFFTKCCPLIGREVYGQLCQNYSSESLQIENVGSYRGSTDLVRVLITPPCFWPKCWPLIGRKVYGQLCQNYSGRLVFFLTSILNLCYQSWYRFRRQFDTKVGSTLLQ